MCGVPFSAKNCCNLLLGQDLFPTSPLSVREMEIVAADWYITLVFHGTNVMGIFFFNFHQVHDEMERCSGLILCAVMPLPSFQMYKL